MTTLSYTDTTVQENTPYLYEILAINGAGTRSEPAPVNVTTPQDDVAPTIVSVEAIAADRIRIVFDEPMNPDSAANPANYRVSHWLSVKAAVLQPDGRTVLLTTALMSSMKTYSLTISNLTDASSLRNPVSGETTVLFTTRFEMEITDVSLRTGSAVTLTEYAVGNYVYSDDLQYFIGSPIPTELAEGCIQFRLPNGPDADRGDKSANYLTFDVSFDVEVWVGFRINETLPAWLSDGTWEQTAFTQYVDKSGSSRYHDFYKKLFSRGEIVLGGNAQDPARVHSNYIVVVRPLTPPNPDTDGDNVPDEWEIAWFGDLSRQPLDDEDLDGWTNFEEFITGTSPIDASSVFKVSAIRLQDGKIELQWPTSPYKYYQVCFASSPLEEWQPLGPRRDANAGPFVDEAASTSSERYYRVEVW